MFELPDLIQSAVDSFLAAPQDVSAHKGVRWRSFVDAWSDFRDWRQIVRILTGLLVSVALTATIAYHPRVMGHATTPEEIAYPRTLFIYAVVGAMIAEAVVIYPSIAFVIFGIGGLLRFRTNVGEASDTGQLILVTIIGITAGLHEFMLAVLGTAVGWTLLYQLRRTTTFVVTVRGLDKHETGEAMDKGRQALLAAGCRLVHERVRRRKKAIEWVVTAPWGVTLATVETRLAGVAGPALDFAVEKV